MCIFGVGCGINFKRPIVKLMLVYQSREYSEICIFGVIV